MTETNKLEEMPLVDFKKAYMGARQTSDSIINGINEYFDYPMTLLMCLTMYYIGTMAWSNGHSFWAIIMFVTALSQFIRIAIKFTTRWWMKRQVKKVEKLSKELPNTLQ